MPTTERGGRLLARAFFVVTPMLGVLLALAVLLVPRVAEAFTPPTPQGAVTDTSGNLSSDDDRFLETQIAAYRNRTGHEVAVLMVGSLNGESVDDVAYTTFNTWGVGQKGNDDGVLLVIAPNERKMRIETGKGVGDKLTDLQSSHILRDDVGPLLKENRFREAIVAGVRGIMTALGMDAPVARRAATPEMHASGGGALAVVLVIMAAAFLVVCVLFVLLVRRLVRGARSYGGGARTYGGGASDPSYAAATTDSWSSGSGGGGSDFGGGSSGGGGSSDSY